MRLRIFTLALALCASLALADDPPSYEQLKKLYDESLKSLEKAQSRKNELSSENETLKAKLAELTKQLADTTSAYEALKQERAPWTLRSNQSAWREFLHHFPDLRHERFLHMSDDDFPSQPIDRDWPLPRAG